MIDLQTSDIRTFIPAREFELSQAFYSALGFHVAWSDANMVLFESNGHRFFLQRYYVKDWADNCMLHIVVADARSCYDQISSLLAEGGFPGARVAAPKQESYALVTYVWDPCGVLIHLAQFPSK